MTPCVPLAVFSPRRHSLGKVVATAAVAAAVPHEVIVGLLDRHAGRDWGDLDAEDKAANDSDHSHAEGRLLASYDTPEHGTIWVITEDLRGEGGGPGADSGCLRLAVREGGKSQSIWVSNACGSAVSGSRSQECAARSLPSFISLRGAQVPLYSARVLVSLRPSVLDPAGEATRAAAARLGVDGVSRLRIGKVVEVELEAPDEATARTQIELLSDRLLANPVIENWTLQLKDGASAGA